jgi:hypothetical protein
LPATEDHARRMKLGFGEVIAPANALRVEVPQQEHMARRVFRPENLSV